MDHGDSLKHVRDATAKLVHDLYVDHHMSTEVVEQLQVKISEENQRQMQILHQIQQCYNTAELFGFDLDAAFQNYLEQQAETALARVASPPPIKQKPKTVREFILDQARVAYPGPVRASALKYSYETEMGGEIHEKTMGMTLYRLSQSGWMRRRGRDWFFIPPHETTSPATAGEVDLD